MQIGFNYILEDKHIGDQEYPKLRLIYKRTNGRLHLKPRETSN